MQFMLSSGSVHADWPVPRRYVSAAPVVSPPLVWGGVPRHAQTLALVVADRIIAGDAAGRWVHWLVWDIPNTTHALAEDAARRGLPAGARCGISAAGRRGYCGSEPVAGVTVFEARLLAVDCVLGDRGALGIGELERVLEGHVCDEACLVARY